MGEQLFVFAYDICDDRRRARFALYLEARAVRVQDSVFEAILGGRAAAVMAAELKAMAQAGDMLRIYPVPLPAISRIEGFGGAPLPEPGGAWIL